MPTPPLQGRRAGPLPPGAVERALLAVAEQQGDLAKLQCAIGQVGLRQLLTRALTSASPQRSGQD